MSGTSIIAQIFIPLRINGRFTFERIHTTKEQIIFYERAEKHKSKERTIL